MVDQPTPGIPVYVVKSITGDRPRVLHRNLLLPLQGRLRQEGAAGKKATLIQIVRVKPLSLLRLHVGGLGGPVM